MATRKLPLVSKELLAYLEETYPDRCPEPETPSRKLWMAAGQAALVRKLRQLHQTQLKDSLG
jgi:hypothetical protein